VPVAAAAAFRPSKRGFFDMWKGNKNKESGFFNIRNLLSMRGWGGG
jgi:hypothetical protein